MRSGTSHRIRCCQPPESEGSSRYGKGAGNRAFSVLPGSGPRHSPGSGSHTARVMETLRKRPVIVIDWSDLKADNAWCLLRAAAPIGGRTLPVPDMVFLGKQQGTRKAEKLSWSIYTRSCRPACDRF